MAKVAIVKTGGKQYLVHENEELIVDRLAGKENESVDLETVAVYDDEKDNLALKATPVKAKILGEVKADKIRVAHFKAKVRYRKVTGHRALLTKLQISSI